MDIDKSNNNEYLVDEYKVKENNLNNQKNNSSLQDEKCFTHVTTSHENCHTEKIEDYTTNKQLVPKNVIEDILKEIRDENGIIALGNALQLACQKSEMVRDYLRDEKLTARDSRKVRNLFVEINRHPKVEVVKKKPQLVVKWIKE